MNVRKVPVDFLLLSAHKFHGPKGVDALYIRSGCRFEPMGRGGGQEKDRRSGTENTAGIVGLGKAAELALARLAAKEHPGAVSAAFEAKVVGEVDGVTVNGDLLQRLPGTSHLSFSDCEAAGLLILLDDMGVACSAGSACMTGKQQPSRVRKAMGFSDAKAKSNLRFGFSCLTPMDEVLAAAEAVKKAVKKAVEKLRRVQGGSTGPVRVYSA